MTVVCYPSHGKKKAAKVCRVFAAGAGGRVAPVEWSSLEDGGAFFYGWTDHTVPLMEKAKAAGRDWYYGDNAYYFGRGTYYRVTLKGLMHDGSGDAGPERFETFGLQVKPWRRNGGHVVIATQSELYYRIKCGVSRDEWAAQVTEHLSSYTDREIVVCHKPPARGPASETHLNFEQVLPGAWAVVSHSSSVMVKSALEGIPVFSIAPSMATMMGLADLSLIEAPLYPDDRDQWLWNLAENQWNYREMEDGIAWRALRDAQPPKFTPAQAPQPPQESEEDAQGLLGPESEEAHTAPAQDGHGAYGR